MYSKSLFKRFLRIIEFNIVRFARDIQVRPKRKYTIKWLYKYFCKVYFASNDSEICYDYNLMTHIEHLTMERVNVMLGRDCIYVTSMIYNSTNSKQYKLYLIVPDRRVSSDPMMFDIIEYTDNMDYRYVIDTPYFIYEIKQNFKPFKTDEILLIHDAYYFIYQIINYITYEKYVNFVSRVI